MQKLREMIDSLDAKPIRVCSRLSGRYEQGGIVYHIGGITGSEGKTADITVEIPTVRLWGGKTIAEADKTAASSHILREFAVAAYMANDEMQQSEDNVQKGCFLVYKFSQRVLANSVVTIRGNTCAVRLRVRLPVGNTAFAGGSMAAMSKKAARAAHDAQKRGVIPAKALRILLTKNLPKLAEDFAAQFSADALDESVRLHQNQRYLRQYLRKYNGAAFIANGACLPRRGTTDFRDPRGVVPFQSPPSLEEEIALPDGTSIRGMLLPAGITVITGDAYHGKSTILAALREGVYDHIPGDGREYVIADATAAEIRAEDGRSIRETDISFFLRQFPGGERDAHCFTTDSASGSTSQAAAVAEALESGCRLMLFDEDRSANNFMFKDDAMRAAIPHATTQPFIDCARMFYEAHGISSILVAGASGEFFGIADRVILVDSFLPTEYDAPKRERPPTEVFRPHPRHADLRGLRELCAYRNMAIRDDNTIRLGGETIPVGDLIPNPSRGQMDFICSFLYWLTVIEPPKRTPLPNAVRALYRRIETDGIGLIHQHRLPGAGEIEFVRPEEMLRILYRLREVRFLR